MADNDSGNQNPQQQPPVQNTGYSQEYVKSLRDESAGWRTKLRDLESKVEKMESDKQSTSIQSVLTAKGVKCDPKWITPTEGQTTEQAVDKFVEQYPQFKVEDKEDNTQNTHTNQATQKPMKGDKENTNTNTRFDANPDLSAVKADPVARAKMRDSYRNMLANKNQNVI